MPEENAPFEGRLEDVYYGQKLVNIWSGAWPFDQGTDGKPEDDGQGSLFDQDQNLPLEEWVALREWLTLVGPVCGVVFHNAKFDIEKMRVGVRRWPGVGIDLLSWLAWDTQNANSLLWPLEPTSLKPTCERLFGAETGDESRVVKSYLQKKKLPAGRWDLMPWDIVGKYAEWDARMTLMLMLHQRYVIAEGGGWWTKPDAWSALERRLETTGVLTRMEWRGLPYDEVGSRLAADEARSRADGLTDTLPFTATDPAAKQYFFGEGKTSKGVDCCNMVPYSVTDKGSPQLTAEILGRMVEEEVPYAGKWAEYKKVSTAASMWYQGYADAVGSDGRLRTCFRQNGTRSSRFSVERVNLQAIPQNYRLSEFSILDGIPTPRALIANAVKAMPGWSLYELDLAQAELRVAAMFAECESMLEMIRNGEDLHSYTTKELFKMDEDHPRWGEYRQVGKRGNFSLLFGSGWKTFKGMVSKEVGIRLEDWEADKIVTDWNRLYPEFREAIDRHMRVVERRQAKYKHGWIDLINGERRWFQQYEEAHKAFNQRVQGNLAQFGIDWMLQTDKYLRSLGFDEVCTPDGGRAGLLLTIHDSQVLLLPTERGDEIAAQCAQFGKNIWKKTFPGVPGDVDYKRWDK